MKYAFGLFFGLLSLGIKAQSDHRFRETGVQIIESNIKTGQHGDPGGQWFVVYRFEGDTMINGLSYQVVNRKNHGYYDFKNHKLQYSDADFQPFGLIRVDTAKKIFFRPLHPLADDDYNDLMENQDNLIYDFNVQAGDTVSWKTGSAKVVASIDSIRLMTGVRRKRIVFSRLPGWEYDNDIWIEGIGGSRGLLGSRYLPKRPSGPFVNITCVFDNRELLEYDYWDSEAVSSAGAFLDCEQDLHVPPEEEYTVNRALEIFPNPTYTNYVTLKSSFLLSDIKSVKLYNHLGQLMEEIPITSKNGTYFFSDISLRDEQAGIYIIVMEVASHGRVAGKILKL